MIRHSGKGRNPGFLFKWTPAFAGVTGLNSCWCRAYAVSAKPHIAIVERKWVSLRSTHPAIYWFRLVRLGMIPVAE
jgi:hypothetical protein